MLPIHTAPARQRPWKKPLSSWWPKAVVAISSTGICIRAAGYAVTLTAIALTIGLPLIALGAIRLSDLRRHRDQDAGSDIGLLCSLVTENGAYLGRLWLRDGSLEWRPHRARDKAPPPFVLRRQDYRSLRVEAMPLGLQSMIMVSCTDGRQALFYVGRMIRWLRKHLEPVGATYAIDFESRK